MEGCGKGPLESAAPIPDIERRGIRSVDEVLRSSPIVGEGLRVRAFVSMV